MKEELEIIITKKKGEEPKIKITPLDDPETFSVKAGKMGGAIVIHIEDEN